MQSEVKTEYYYRYFASVVWETTGFLHTETKARVHYHCTPYPVIKRTDKGAWIDEHGKKRFILTDAVKKWAAPTKKEAWLNYKARSKHALQHAKNNLEKIEAARSTEQFMKDDPPDEIQYSASSL